MQTAKWIFNALNYGFYCLYSFTFIDVIRKLIFDQFNINNATNFVQFILTVIGVFFAYYKLKTYIRDSKIRSKILEQELLEKERSNFPYKWHKEFIFPFEKEAVKNN